MSKKTSLKKIEQPMHIGVTTGTGEFKGRYLITAEYMDGYKILAGFTTLAAAEAALKRYSKELDHV